MALIKCKECKTEISNKVKTCPKCGAPQGPKQYSLGKLIILIVFGAFMYSLFTGNSHKTPRPPNTNQAMAALVTPTPNSSNFNIPVKYEYLSKDNSVIAEKALGLFVKSCYPLMSSHISDIESISISDGFEKDKYYGCKDYRCDNYGWERELHIKVKIRNNVSTFHNEMVHISGHTLHFWLGGPTNPGITTTKFPEVCGAHKVADGSDTYIPVQNMRALWQ